MFSFSKCAKSNAKKCPNDAMYKCINNYVNSMLNMAKFGLLKPIAEEKEDDYFPSASIISPDIEDSEDDISKVSEIIGQQLQEIEFRKKYVEIHLKSSVYILGGYLFGRGESIRKSPNCEYKYIKEDGNFQAIPKLGRGRVNFGAGTDGSNIMIVGGQDYSNRSLKSCLMLNTKTDKWQPVQALPAPTVAPGLCFSREYVHILGGYDIISGNIDIIGDHLVYDIRNDIWYNLPPIRPKRSRPMIIYPDGENIEPGLYCIGGVALNDETMKSYALEEIQRFNYIENKWSLLTKTPALTNENFVSYSDGKFQISKKVKDELGNLIELTPTKCYNLIDRQWYDGMGPKSKQGEENLKESDNFKDGGNHDFVRSAEEGSPKDNSKTKIEKKNKEVKAASKKQKSTPKKTIEKPGAISEDADSPLEGADGERKHRSKKKNKGKSRSKGGGKTRKSKRTDGEGKKTREESFDDSEIDIKYPKSTEGVKDEEHQKLSEKMKSKKEKRRKGKKDDKEKRDGSSKKDRKKKKKKTQNAKSKNADADIFSSGSDSETSDFTSFYSSDIESVSESICVVNASYSGSSFSNFSLFTERKLRR